MRRPLPALLVAALLGACQPAAPPPSAPPRLAVAPAVQHDFGRVPQGVPVEHTFALTNVGGTPLTLIDLRTSCDCQAELDGPRDLAPGAGVALVLRCETARSAGPQRHTLTVYSNDPGQRALLLALTGTVALAAAAEPARVYLGPLPPGTTAARRIALRAGDDAVRFFAPDGGAPWLQARLVDEAGGRALELATAPDAPPGAFQTVVRVRTTSAARPTIEVPVAGIIAPPTVAAGRG